MGIGVHREWHDPLWPELGAGAAVGAALTFLAVARWNQRYYRTADGREPGLAFQQTVGKHTSNPVDSFLRRVGVLGTRAAMAYYIIVFALFGGIPLLLLFAFVGTNLAWTLTLYAHRLPVTILSSYAGGELRPEPSQEP